MTTLTVGRAIHGYAGGAFGRDSYNCRRIEAAGTDWVVTRNDAGHAEFALIRHLAGVDPDDRSHCSTNCGGPDPREVDVAIAATTPGPVTTFEGIDVGTLERLATIFPGTALDLQYENARWHLDRAYENKVRATYENQAALLGAAKRWRDRV